MDGDESHLNVAIGLGEQLLMSSIPQELTGLLMKLDQKRDEERETGFKILGIFENIFEIKPDAIQIAGPQTGLAAWLLDQIAPEGGVEQAVENFNDNALYSSEILSIVLQHPANQDCLFSSRKIPRVLEYLRTLLDRDKFPADFKETVLNLLNCLALTLMNLQAREEFADCEGIDIMIRLLK